MFSEKLGKIIINLPGYFPSAPNAPVIYSQMSPLWDMSSAIKIKYYNAYVYRLVCKLVNRHNSQDDKCCLIWDGSEIFPVL